MRHVESNGVERHVCNLGALKPLSKLLESAPE